MVLSVSRDMFSESTRRSTVPVVHRRKRKAPKRRVKRNSRKKTRWSTEALETAAESKGRPGVSPVDGRNQSKSQFDERKTAQLMKYKTS